MKYFVVNGFCPLPHPPEVVGSGYTSTSFVGNAVTRQQRIRSYQELGIPLPNLGEKVFLRDPRVGKISLFVHGAYDAFILIAASSQKRAYLLGNGLRAAISVFHGNAPTDRTYYDYLLELSKPPTTDMTRRDLANCINISLSIDRRDRSFLVLELGTGSIVNHIDLSEGCIVVANSLRNPRMLDALLHLEYSMRLVCGFMSGSFYDSHYSREREELTRYQIERIYLENRFRYDSAFVSAFRGLECILGKPYFMKNDIPVRLRKLDNEFGTSFAMSRYRLWHESFSSKRKWSTYPKLIEHYLKLRNSVSAHGNPSPPFIVMEDQVFEIQFLIRNMLAEILMKRSNSNNPDLS
jgi:hypothetical protein